MEDVDNFINGEGSQTDDDDVSNEETDTEEHSKGKENIRLRKLSPVTSASALLVHQKKPTTKSLVDNAITNLGERNGSSLIAIKKFIVLKNPSLDADRLNGFIKRYIKKALEKGDMVQFKKRFKLVQTKSRPNKAEEKAKSNNVNKKKTLLRNGLQPQGKGTSKATAAIRKKENDKANAPIKSPPKEKVKPKTKSTIKNRAKQDAATAKVQAIKHSKTDGNATPTKATNKKITEKLPRKSIITATKATRSNIKTTKKVAPKKKGSVDKTDSKTGTQKKRK